MSASIFNYVSFTTARILHFIFMNLSIRAVYYYFVGLPKKQSFKTLDQALRKRQKLF